MESSERKKIYAVALLGAITIIAFLSVLDNGFTNWDDQKFLTHNTLIQEMSWDNARILFTTFYKDYYRPLTVMLSFSLEYYFFQLNPFIYHLDNLLLHLANTLLVFCFIHLLSRNLAVSFIAAVFFGVHPLHVEPVAWISERKGLLSAFFFMQALIFYLLYRQRGGKGWYALALPVFALSLLSKGVAVILPLALFLCDYLEEREFTASVVIDKIPFFIISGIFTFDTLFMYQSTGHVSAPESLSLFNNTLVGLQNITSYLAKIVVPLNLSAIYPYPEEVSILKPAFLLPPIVLALLALLLFYTTRYTRKGLFGILFFIVTILPVLKLIPFVSGGASMADRYAYVPSIGLFYIGGVIFQKVYSGGGEHDRLKKSLSLALLIIAVVTFSFLTYHRNNIWQNSESLWKDVIKKYPHVLIAHNNLGTAYYDAGRLDEAVKAYKNALEVNPAYTAARSNLAAAYKKQGKLWEAAGELQSVLALTPVYPSAHNNLASVYEDLGQLDEAVVEYRTVIEQSPGSAEAYNNLGRALYKQGRYGEAVGAEKRAIELRPNFIEARMNLGLSYAGMGRYDDAIGEYRIVTGDRPDHAKAHNNLGNAYAATGRFSDAVNAYRMALKWEPEYSETHYNLGLAYANNGMLEEAAEALKQAIRYKPHYLAARRSLGAVYYDLGLWDQAAGEYVEVIRLDPARPDVYNDLGIAYARLNSPDQAIESFKAALRLKPDYGDARENLKKVERLKGLER